MEAVLEPPMRKEGHGEWFFAFHPARYDAARWTDRDYLEELIRKHRFRIVQEFPPSHTGTQRREWGIANSTYGEPWALTRSGLFVSRLPFREDRVVEPICAHLYCPTYDTHELSLGPGNWIEYRWSLRDLRVILLHVADGRRIRSGRDNRVSTEGRSAGGAKVGDAP